MMTTADLSLRFDPIYEPIARRFLENPEAVRRRLRPRLVQADPPRHGPARALSRPGGPGRGPDLAGPGARGRSQADRREGHRRPQEEDPRLGAVGLPAGLDGLGVGVHLPRLRQARRRQRGAHPPRAAEGLGGQPAGPAAEGAEDPREDPQGVQRRADRRQEGLAGRPDRPGRLRGRRAGGEERRPRRDRALHAGAHGCVAEADRRGVLRRARAGGGRLPQLPQGRSTPCRRRSCWSTGRSC